MLKNFSTPLFRSFARFSLFHCPKQRTVFQITQEIREIFHATAGQMRFRWYPPK